MTNLLNLEDYDNIRKEKLQSQALKNDWKHYKKTGRKRNLKKIMVIKNAKRKGISIH